MRRREQVHSRNRSAKRFAGQRPGELLRPQGRRPLRRAIPFLALRGLSDHGDIRRVANAHAAPDLRFHQGPVGVLIQTCGLTLGMRAHFKIDFFGLHAAYQPQATQSESRQNQA
jgi:hypothetical protein